MAEMFVDDLLTEGSKITCDESCPSFNNNKNLPPYYNEASFKQGQQFFRRNIFAMLVSKLMGLVSILSIPSILRVLQFTKMSSEDLSAYKRYMATLLHMKVWYEHDFEPSSDLWKSIENVKCRHNNASKRSCNVGNPRITQLDMALTQFGFMGFAITRTEMVGVHVTNAEELRNFVHVWRVVGHLMGIEDRFNICRESLEETRAICEELITRVFKPSVEKQEEQFVFMSFRLIKGMWVMHPVLEEQSFMNYLIKLLNNGQVEDCVVYKEQKIQMTFGQRFNERFVELALVGLKFYLIRVFQNFMMHLSFFLMRHFPFLAFYKFGYKNSIVTILDGPTQEIQRKEDAHSSWTKYCMEKIKMKR